MAERPERGPGARRRSRRDSLDAPSQTGGACGVSGGSALRTPPGSKDRRASKKVKERWLLTRKTWRYMADAGRRLIPDSVSSSHTRPEDIPKIEQYFQEVCTRESKFLLWRKASYPGSLALRAARRRRHKPGGSCRAKTASSADEAEDSRGSNSSVGLPSSPVVTGKLDLAKLKRDWLLSSTPSSPRPEATSLSGQGGIIGGGGGGGGSSPSTSSPIQERRRLAHEEAEAKALADMLQKYLNMQSSTTTITTERTTTLTTTKSQLRQQRVTGTNAPTTTNTTTTTATGSDSSAKSSTAPSTRSYSAEQSMGGGPAKEPATTRSHGTSLNLPSTSSLDYQKLIEKLEQHLSQIMAEGRREEAARAAAKARLGSGNGASSSTSGLTGSSLPKVTMPYQSDFVHKSLLETLSRYYSKSPNREHVISDILTDRKLLEKLYFELRCTRGFRGPRATGAYTSPSARWWTQPGSSASNPAAAARAARLAKEAEEFASSGGAAERGKLGSPPPLIAVQGPSTERGVIEFGTQTEPVAREILETLLQEREEQLQQQAGSSQSSKSESHREQQHRPGRRRSSVDNDDVSPSVSDTIKRYLRMARKKSMDADKADRFKRVNYDRNLRNIKAKGEITKPGDDDGNNKGCQTEDSWMINYREMSHHEPGEVISDAETTASPISRNASSRSSIDAGLGSEDAPTTPKHHQSFLSHLLHGSHGGGHKDKPHSAPGSPALNASSNLTGGGGAMQKSKSSSSVVHHGSRLVAKKIWKSRSKSSSRAISLVPAWTPQGKCTWAGTNNRRVTLQDTQLRSLTEVERKVLCRVAVAKLQALNLGVHIRPPSESLSGGTVTQKPKRRAYLLKRKALTTGFFTDSKSKEEKDKESSGGLVFGISLAQCLENDRLARIASGEIVDVGCLSRNSRHGSRTSFTSLIETTTASKTDEGGSCESLSSKGGALTSSDSGVLGELSDGGQSNEYDAVPTVVRQCIKHLETTGLRTLGIFRVSPSKKRVRQLREDWDCGRENKIGPDQCPHDVAALLKEYFRDLPDPLLCRDLYQAFVHTQKIRNRRLQQEALQHLIQLLPTPNRETLYALLTFLSEVAANSEDRKTDDGEWLPGNKMDTTNLATVFAPNILHCVKPGQARSELSERIDVINVVRALLEHVNELFVVPSALLDELYLHMMDSHPAELDAALSRRVEEVVATDELELCSETDNYSVEDTASPGTATTSPTSPTAPTSLAAAVSAAAAALSTSATTSTTTAAAATTTTARKLYSREECLHQTAGVGGDIGPKPRRSKRTVTRRSIKDESSTTTRSNSLDSGSSEEPVDTRYKTTSAGNTNSPMVITASLTIPMSGAFTLNLDDPDIPYIEDPTNQQTKQSTQQTVQQQQQLSHQQQQQQQPNVPPRRQRQRSVSGSEGGGGRHGSDSAVGSSATLSGDQAPSSPASWASSPPASPDSAVTAVSYIPDQPQLQRVSFTTSSEITRQIARSTSQQDNVKPVVTNVTSQPVPQSPAHTPSITSIGGAVMRSKTADIERMLQISRGTTDNSLSSNQGSKQQTSITTTAAALIDSKKYTKRRYTDSRHQTRHIPDAESLASSTPSPTSLASRLTAALHHQRGSTNSTTASTTTHVTANTGTSASNTNNQPVWKRRELISSAPKERGSFF